MPPDTILGPDFPSESKPAWLGKQNYMVDILREIEPNKGVKSVTQIVAHSLAKLLDSNLSHKIFYFVSNPDDSLSNARENGHNESSGDELPHHDKSFNNSSNGYGSVGDESSVLGSPLKLNKIANLEALSPARPMLIKEKLPGATGLDISRQIPVQDARKVLQKFIETNKGELKQQMLSVLCSLEDVKKTLMIGIHKNVAFSLSMKRIQLSCIEESQIWNCDGQKFQLESQYELLDSSLGLGSITMTAQWEDLKGSLKITKPLSTEFYLEWNTVTGHQQNPVYALYRELQKVSSFVEVLKTDGDLESVFPDRDGPGGNAVKQLRELFTNKKDAQGVVRRTVPGLADASTNRLNLSPGTDTDFLDEIWDVISGCSSLPEMVGLLKETFSEMRRGQMRVYVSSDNRSTLANLSRAATSGLPVFPPLNDQHLALRLVTEVGVEKLRKLYHAIMVTGNKLFSPAQWDKLFNQEALSPRALPGESCDEELEALFKQMPVLEKLHRCLECVAIMDAFTDCQDLTEIASTVLCSDGGLGGYKMRVNPALALPELEKHEWASMRRTTRADCTSTVETFLHSMPAGILEKTPCDSNSVWYFRAQHNVVQF